MTAKDIKNTLNTYLDKTIKEKEVLAALESLGSKYDNEKYPFEIIQIAEGYQFMTKGTYYPLVSQFLRIESKKKLSKAALETLAVVSYKQPITKSVIESIRGVGCDYSIQKLLEKELVEIGGRAEGPGRPLLYITSQKFMDHFGLKDLKDLPKIKEFEMPGDEIGLNNTDDVPAPDGEQQEAAQEQSTEEQIESTNNTEDHKEETVVPTDNQELNEPKSMDAVPTISDEEEE